MKNKVINVSIWILSILFILETVLNKSYTNKIILIGISISSIYMLIKNKFTRKEWVVSLLLVIYIIARFQNTIRSGLNNSLYTCFTIAVLTFYLYFLSFLSKIKLNRENIKKTILIISAIFTLIYFVNLFIFHKVILQSEILVLFVIIIYLYFLENKKLLSFIFDILIVISAIIEKNILLLILALIANLFFVIKDKNDINYKKIAKYISCILIGCAIITITINQNQPNINKSKDIEYIVRNEYEFPSERNKNNDSLEYIMKDRTLNEKIYGCATDKIINNINVNNISIIFIYVQLGLFGFIIYISILIYYIIKQIKYKNINIDFIILIIYSLLSPTLLIPYMYMILALYTIPIKREESIKGIVKKDAILMLLITLVPIIFLLLPKSYKYESIELDISKINSENKNLVLLEKKDNKTDEVEEKLFYYNLKNKNNNIAKIIVSIRKIDEITFKFITIETLEQDVTIKLKISNNKLDLIKSFEEYNIERPFSTLVGYDKLTLPIGYFKDFEKEYIISQTFNYTSLNSTYGNGNKSTIYNLIDQDNDLINNYKEIHLKANTNADMYVIESEESIFANEEELKLYIDLINKNSSWLTYRGNNYKLPYSIEPFTKDGYGKNVGKIIEKDIYNLSKNSDSKILKAINKNSIHSLFKHSAQNAENEEGIWFTNYTSTWLKKDYGIKAYYIDTRLNETIGYMLLDLYNDTKIEKYKKAFQNYADFIVEVWGKESYYIGNNKVLPDYFSNNHDQKTHSSLNHQLSLVNYLFKAYEVMDNKIYYNTAQTILNGLLGFGNQWIRENNDLWYEINSNGEFIGNDYEIVTLDDLLFTQSYLIKYENKKNKQIEEYIKSKLKYLNDKKIKIPESTQSLIESQNIKY